MARRSMYPSVRLTNSFGCIHPSALRSIFVPTDKLYYHTRKRKEKTFRRSRRNIFRHANTAFPLPPQLVLRCGVRNPLFASETQRREPAGREKKVYRGRQRQNIPPGGVKETTKFENPNQSLPPLKSGDNRFPPSTLINADDPYPFLPSDSDTKRRP